MSEHIGLSSDSYGSVFYLTTGFHGIHVTGGLDSLPLRARTRPTSLKTLHARPGHPSAIVVSYYWHFVDVVWIGLFAVIYLLK